MNYLYMVFFTLLALGVLVTIHEYGHFWVARKCGIKVLRFSIGFGSPIFKWRDKLGTEFVIALLPLGGYVKMVDERESAVAAEELDGAFNRKPVWQRILVVVAGPVANFLLAVVIYWVVFLGGIQGVAPFVGDVTANSIAAEAGVKAGDEIIAIDGKPVATMQALRERLIYRIGETGILELTVLSDGETTPYNLSLKLEKWLGDAQDIDPIQGLGIDFYRPAIIPVADQILPNSAAERAGLIAGDRIIMADGVVINDWAMWVDYVRNRPEQPIKIKISRGSDEHFIDITPDIITDKAGVSVGQVGMSVLIPRLPDKLIRTTDYNPVEAFSAALKKTSDNSLMILDSIGKILNGLISAKHLSGPITIAKVAGTSAQYGVMAYLSFLAFLSVSLGVLNLLPIPVLDGGHLAYYLIEAVKGSPVSEKIQIAGFRIGILLVAGLMIVALYNDLMRL